MDKVQIFQGGTHTDFRGQLKYINDLSIDGVQRMYSVYHPDTSIIRAWQGHPTESKYYLVIKGIWLAAWVFMDDTLPESSWKADYAFLREEYTEMIYLPPGYANGFKALVPDSIILCLSIPGNESETIRRWPADTWLDWTKFEL